MKLENFLTRRKSVIVNKWFDLIIETYPPESSRLLRRKKEQFDNPVGYTISQGIEALYKALLEGTEPDRISPFVENLMRIKAIQGFSPSQAVAIIFILKKVIRSELLNEAQEEMVARDLLALESRIDDLALLSFDLYMKSREKLYELRANETKNAYFKLLKRANLICDVSQQVQAIHNGTSESST